MIDHDSMPMWQPLQPEARLATNFEVATALMQVRAETSMASAQLVLQCNAQRLYSALAHHGLVILMGTRAHITSRGAAWLAAYSADNDWAEEEPWRPLAEAPAG